MYHTVLQPKATKCVDHYTISLSTHTAKTVTRILKRRTEKKIQDVFGDQFGIRKGTRMPKSTSEQTLDKDEELRACFIEREKEFHHVNWTKLMQILKETDLYSHERKLISKSYMYQCIKVWVHQQDGTSVKIRSGVRQGGCHQFY